MLKVEVDIKKGEIKTEANGPDPLIYVEMGMVVKKFYQILCNYNPKKRAKRLMQRLIESSLMEDKEIEKKFAKFKEEEPEVFKAAKMLRDFLLGTEGEGNE